MVARELCYPYQVQSIADLPEGIRQSVDQSLKPGESVNLIVFFPPRTVPGSWKGDLSPAFPLAVLATSQGVLCVHGKSSPARFPAATSFHANRLLYVLNSLVLLYGRLEFVGEENGDLARIVVEYNAIGQSLMELLIKQCLSMAYGPLNPEASRGKLNDFLLKQLAAESIKFWNGLRLHALQPGEKLLGYVFQPRIVQRSWYWFHHPIAPATLLALTDQALILIKEDWSRVSSYGWHITICPRDCVAEIRTAPNREWSDVSVHLIRNNVTVEHRVTVENGIAQRWEELWSAQCENQGRAVSLFPSL